jgi:PKHD-type hydroxylase
MSTIESYRFAYTFPSIDRSDGKEVLSWEQGMEPFHAQLEMDANPGIHLIRCAPGAFSADECRQIVEFGDALPQADAKVEDHRLAHYRAGQLSWIAPHPATFWLFHKLAVLFNEVNAHFSFELLGLLDSPQFTVYGAGDHFNWHVDIGAGAASLRKLSMTVQLTDGAQYEGGDLEFHDELDPRVQRALGTATVFPSYLAHRVTPITSGTRRSLVAWACGPSFR